MTVLSNAQKPIPGIKKKNFFFFNKECVPNKGKKLYKTDLNERKTSDLPVKGLKITVIKILRSGKDFTNKVRISIKRKDKNVNQIEITELKNIITKMKIL